MAATLKELQVKLKRYQKRLDETKLDNWAYEVQVIEQKIEKIHQEKKSKKRS